MKTIFRKRNKNILKNRKFLVTAGPTYEMIDPVRFIGNFSSGKMGFQIANALTENGAEVILIAGPNNLSINNKNIKILNVVTANEMYNACIQNFNENIDGAILAAAVSDFTPKIKSNLKIKQKDVLTIELVPTKDIAFELGKLKTSKQKLIGFALETNNEIENAKQKLEKKNFDFIVLNSLHDEGAGFHVETNKISIIDKNGIINHYNIKPKAEVARDIVKKLITIL